LQVSVATYWRYGGKYYMGFVANWLGFLPVKEFWKSVKNWQSYRHEFGVLLFWGQSVYNLAVVIHITTCSAVCSIGCHKLSYSQLDIIIKWMVLAETATCWLITTAICEDELSIVSCSSTVSATTVGDCCSWVIYRPSTLSTHQLLYYADMLFWLWMSVSDSHVAIAAVVVMWIFITIFDGEQFV